MNRLTKQLLTIMIFTLLVSCGAGEKIWPKDPEDETIDHKKKQKLYLELIKGQQDEFGFIESDDCDSIVFTGLASAAGVPNIEITAARRKDGRWFRRPGKDCYRKRKPNGKRLSESECSRDGFIGLAWSIYYQRNLVVAEDLLRYAKKHYYVMCAGVLSRTIMSANLHRTFAKITGKSQGGILGDKWGRPTGYAAHIQILHILLRGSLDGSVSKAMMSAVTWQYDRQPQNALFTYAYHLYTDGDMSEVYAALEDERIFPSDRLPTSEDRCGRWIFERDYGSEWEGCDEGRTHSGADYLFLLKRLES